MISRRLLMGAGGATIALAACGQAPVSTTPKTAATGGRIISQVGLQTYTLRSAMADDFRGTFQMIKDVGYDYVELNERNFSVMPAAELKSMLDDMGLPVPASHISYAGVSDAIPAMVSDAKALGAKYMVLPYVDEAQRTLADWKRHAQNLNQAGQQLSDVGSKIAYHNHQFEFDDLGGGTTAMEVLMNETSPELVDFELDMFWVALANQDSAALIKRYPGRFKLCHIKDMKGDPKAALARGDSYETITSTIMVNVGEGTIPFEDYFALNDISGMEYFIAEHDNPVAPYRDAVKTSLDNIKAMRF